MDDFKPNVYNQYSSNSASAKYNPGNNCDPNGYNPKDPIRLDNWEKQLAKKQ